MRMYVIYTCLQAKAGDKVIFTGTLIVVPDVSALSRSGESAQSVRGGGGSRDSNGEGVRGLKTLGCRDMTYRLAFLSCSVQSSEHRFGNVDIRQESDVDVASQFTPEV